MPGLGETVAAALARARTMSAPEAGADLAPVAGFGPNPGALQMWLHAPEALPARAPLVVVLHGCGQTAAGYAEGVGWIELADRYGFALLCPQQVRSNNANLCFNWFEDDDTRRGSGEAASIAQVARHALTALDLDRRRVFVTGLSAGGAMAAVMLATYPELFAGGAVVAGLPYGAASGVTQALGAMRRTPDLRPRDWGDKVRAAGPAPARWPRMSIWHGDADATVSPGAADALARQWCDVHGVHLRETAPTVASGHSHVLWRGPDGAAAVELHRLAGLGHGTPIAVNGVGGCGSPGAWILETGVSSSFEIARSWGLVGAARPLRASAPVDRPPPDRASAPQASAPSLETVITGALRKAGLLRLG